jgi:hypothetical protein
VIGTALALLFGALAVIGALSRAAMARSHRDATGFALWTGSAVIVVLVALSTIVFRDAWADLYDSVTDLLWSK